MLRTRDPDVPSSSSSPSSRTGTRADRSSRRTRRASIDQPPKSRSSGDGRFLGTIDRDGSGPYNVTALVPHRGQRRRVSSNVEDAPRGGHRLSGRGLERSTSSVPEGAMHRARQAEQLEDRLVVRGAVGRDPIRLRELPRRDAAATPGRRTLHLRHGRVRTSSADRAGTVSSVECFATYQAGATASTTRRRWRSSCATSGVPARVVEGFLPGKRGRTRRRGDRLQRPAPRTGSRSTSRATAGSTFDPTGGGVGSAGGVHPAQPVAGLAAPRPAAVAIAAPARGSPVAAR